MGCHLVPALGPTLTGSQRSDPRSRGVWFVLSAVTLLVLALTNLATARAVAAWSVRAFVDERSSTSSTCAVEVGAPTDKYPIRSPQDVQSVVADIVRGHSVVEFGTRNGDGMECFARFASSAVAIELDANYCTILELRAVPRGTQRSTRLRRWLYSHDAPPFDRRGGFNVRCSRYQDVVIDADYYTWWSQGPHLTTVPALLHLRRAQQKKRIRPNATALVLLAHGELEEYMRFSRNAQPRIPPPVMTAPRGRCMSYVCGAPQVSPVGCGPAGILSARRALSRDGVEASRGAWARGIP